MTRHTLLTLSEIENEWQKTDPVPIPLHRAPRLFPDSNTRNNFESFVCDLLASVCLVNRNRCKCQH